MFIEGVKEDLTDVKRMLRDRLFWKMLLEMIKDYSWQAM